MKSKLIRSGLLFVLVLLLTGCIVGPQSKVEDAVILTPVLLSPENGSATNGNAPKFEWYAISGVTEYTFEIKLVSDDSVVAKERYQAEKRCDTTVCSIPAPVELAPADYKWHVVAWVEDVRGEYSKYFTLTINEE